MSRSMLDCERDRLSYLLFSRSEMVVLLAYMMFRQPSISSTNLLALGTIAQDMRMNKTFPNFSVSRRLRTSLKSTSKKRKSKQHTALIFPFF
jgi:hypothetical protein